MGTANRRIHLGMNLISTMAAPMQEISFTKMLKR